MRLDDVRDLKKMVIRDVLVPLVESTPKRIRTPTPTVLAAAISIPETLALGITMRRTGDFALAVRVQQRWLEESPTIDRIGRLAHKQGGNVEVRYVGNVVMASAPPWHQARHRPLRPGCSVSHAKTTAGTLGCFVRAQDTAEPLLLSNNHVLANCNGGRIRDPILQPGTFDGGKLPDDAVARLNTWVKLKRVGPNLVDAALAALKDGMDLDARILQGIGKLKAGVAPVDIGDVVAKTGRTTGATRGRVTAIEVSNLIVGTPIGNLHFDDQIEIEGADSGPFALGGDSGSLIVNEDKQGAALLFAVGDQGGANGKGLAYANPLQAVLDALKVNVLY